MLNKISIIFLVVLLNNTSCVESSKKDSPTPKWSFWKTKFEEMESYLPKKINHKDYLMIFRIGSIEFSPQCSVLCLPKNELGNGEIKCEYYIINEAESFVIEPEIIGFQIMLKNEFNRNKLDLGKLKRIDFNTFDSLINLKPREYSGEWHCGNIYVINPNSEEPILLNKDSEATERNFFISLYQQISPSEYFQCMALNESCKDRQDLIVWLQTQEAKDSLKFKILKEYWYLGSR